jgi:hypothetical protein
MAGWIFARASKAGSSEWAIQWRPDWNLQIGNRVQGPVRTRARSRVTVHTLPLTEVGTGAGRRRVGPGLAPGQGPGPRSREPCTGPPGLLGLFGGRARVLGHVMALRVRPGPTRDSPGRRAAGRVPARPPHGGAPVRSLSGTEGAPGRGTCQGRSRRGSNPARNRLAETAPKCYSALEVHHNTVNPVHTAPS